MDWLSFLLGFLAFPLTGAVVVGLFAVGRRLHSGEPSLSNPTASRGSTLSFSSRLIGEIGEQIDSEAGPAAKAS